MAKSLLTKNQSNFLTLFGSDSELSKHFYLTGGTALSEYYLKHRFSEDLDFFSEGEFSITDITPFIKKSQTKLGFKKFDYQQSFNRNIYQLIFPSNKFLKVEFTYFPFRQIEKPKKTLGVPVDSLLDIAVNKVFTVHQNPRGRDYFDLYVILNKEKWSFSDLIKKARMKFDARVDPLQLGSQLIKVKDLLDDPILKDSTVKRGDVEDFFLNEAKKLEKFILKK
jgi:predicted nucleotidyltransferase component of viral defense system